VYSPATWEGEYDLDRGLDAVMDMVLKELRE
jgi:hypothetical protein